LVYELTDENWGVCGWRARDEVLGRDVLLTTFHPDDPRAHALVTAARSAARVDDHRFVRVLDAHIEQPTGFLVREWTGGQTLSDILGNGPLPEPVAAAVALEVAEALQEAHRAGLHHLCIDPSTVMLDVDGSVRVRGLGTAAVLRGVQPSAAGAARDDAEGVGRVLYAALTAKSPTATPSALPVVARDDATVPAPRQVRAGVSPLLDAITVRALGSGRSHRFEPYPSPGEVARALTRVEESRGRPAALTVAATSSGHDPHPDTAGAAGHARPALDAEPGPPPPPLLPLHAYPEDEDDGGPRRGRWLRAAVIAVAVMMGAGAFLLGLELIAANRVPDLDPADSPNATAAPTTPGSPTSDAAPSVAAGDLVVQPVVATSDYDPLGNGEENGDRTALAVDGDPATAWPTQTYFDPLELQKAGVGLLLDLGSPRPVTELDLTLLGSPADVEVRVAPETASAIPATPEGFIQVARVTGASTSQTVEVEPRTSRYVLIWFTQLPTVADGWRGGVSEVVVSG
jgi:hypothetical protein